MKYVESGVCHCGTAMEDHTSGGSCTSPKDMPIPLNDSEWIAYRRGFEAAKAEQDAIVAAAVAAAERCAAIAKHCRTELSNAGDDDWRLAEMIERRIREVPE